MFTLTFDHSSKVPALLKDRHLASSPLGDAVQSTASSFAHTGKYYSGTLVGEILQALRPAGDCAGVVLCEEATDAQMVAFDKFIDRLSKGDLVSIREPMR
jgi:hypothetical protein